MIGNRFLAIGDGKSLLFDILAQSSPPMPADIPVADRTQRNRLDLTREEQQQLRIVTAQNGLSMAAFARQVVLEAITPEITNPRKKGGER